MRSQFQFHKGTIRTAEQEDLCRREAHFNSIKVRLELTKEFTGYTGEAYFNSIKVRLELGRDAREEYRIA